MISSSSVILWFQSVEAVERIISPASRFSLLSVRRESVVVCILNSSRNFVLSWKLTISFLQIFFFFWFLFQSDLRFTSPLKYWRDTWIWALRDFNRKFYSSSHPGLNRTIQSLQRIQSFHKSFFFSAEQLKDRWTFVILSWRVIFLLFQTTNRSKQHETVISIKNKI